MASRLLLVDLVIQKSQLTKTGGFTLAETIVTAAISLMGIGAAMTMNTAHMRLVQSSRQSNAATVSLQERVEQMRLADWRKITDAAYLKTVLLAQAPRSSTPLDGMTEKIVVTAYPDPDVADPLVVERDADGATTTIAAGSGLTVQRLAQVELRIGWNGSDGRERVRATTTVISNGGISRMNLPGIGAPGGSPPADSSSDPSEPTDSTTDPDTTTPTQDPTPTPTNDNGNGRGNVGGKSGKK